MLFQNTVRVVFIIAFLSGLLTYDGIASTAGSSDWWLKSVFGLTAIVVTIIISHFWQYAFSIVPDLSLGLFRARGWLIVSTGVLCILAVSTYWNIVSLTKHEIGRLGSASVVVRAENILGTSSRLINGYQTYLVDVASLGADIRSLEEAEKSGGSSGIASAGPVSRTFGQVATRVETISKSANAAKAKIDTLQNSASNCLADLKSAMSRNNQDKASKAASCINQSISQMAGMDIASTLVRSLNGLTAGIVLPSAIKRETQKTAIARFMQETQNRAEGLATKISRREKLKLPQPLTLEQSNILKGVLLHWHSLVPAIATALAIDLLPLILLMFTALRYDDQRTRNEPKRSWTINEIYEAAQIVDSLSRLQKLEGPKPDLPNYIDVEPAQPKQIVSKHFENQDADTQSPNQSNDRDDHQDPDGVKS